jgi:electron transport complex protein RnfE
MSNVNYQRITRDGLWDNNIAFVQVLGLCPLLAVSSTATNGLGLGIATTLVLIASNMTVSLIRNVVRPEIRIPVFMLIIASFVTAVELAMNAWFYDLYKVLGIFIPLIVTNCAILGRAEAFAARNPIPASIIDGLSMGVGFTLVLVVLGSIREISGFGTLFAKADLMFGESVSWMSITVFNDYNGFLLAILPPGAFIGLGLLAALKNVIDARISRRHRTVATVVVETSSQA